jgi:hypothetical protein
MLSQDITFDLFFHRISYDCKKVDSQEPFLGVPIEQVNYLAGTKSMAMTKVRLSRRWMRRVRRVVRRR